MRWTRDDDDDLDTGLYLLYLYRILPNRVNIVGRGHICIGNNDESSLFHVAILDSSDVPRIQKDWGNLVRTVQNIAR